MSVDPATAGDTAETPSSATSDSVASGPPANDMSFESAATKTDESASFPVSPASISPFGTVTPQPVASPVSADKYLQQLAQ